MLLRYVFCAIIGYLLGNFETGLIFGKLLHRVDLRSHGSGSAGATNALRVLGKKHALITMLGDIAKGSIAAAVGMWIGGWHGGMVAAFLCAAGHIWPVFFGFHGGKGVATSLGALMVLLPLHTLGMFIAGVLVIWRTKMVSLGSIVAALVFLVAASITAFVQAEWFLLVFAILMSGLVIYAHHGNIDRLLRGTENKLSSSMFEK